MKLHVPVILLTAILCHAPYALAPYDSADSKGYKLYANNLLEHHVYGWSEQEPIQPSAYRVPAYSLFLCAIYAVGGQDSHVYALQLLISALTCLSIYYIAHTIWASHRVAFWSGFLCALHPILGYLTGTILSETLFTFLLSVAALSITRALVLRSYRWCLLGGAMLSVATLCRPVTQFLWLFILLGMLVTYRNARHLRGMALTFVLGMLLVLAPWTARNFVSLNTFAPFSHGGTGMAIYLATRDPDIYHPIRQPDMNVAGKRDATLKLFLDGLHQFDDAKMQQAEENMREVGWATVREHPIKYVWERIKVHPYLWVGSAYLIDSSWEDTQHAGHAVRLLKGAVLVMFHVAPLLAYMAYLWVGRHTWRTWWWPYCIPLYTALVFLPLHFDFRYSMPAYPYILMFAVAALFRPASAVRHGAPQSP